MTVYTFRVSLADDDNIYRDVEIKAPQTFYNSGDDWQKGKKLKKTGDTKLQNLIEKAKTKWICEPSSGLFGNYLIELTSMDGNEDTEATYPRVIKKYGMLPGALLDTTDEEFSAQVVLEEQSTDLDDDDDDDEYDENF